MPSLKGFEAHLEMDGQQLLEYRVERGDSTITCFVVGPPDTDFTMAWTDRLGATASCGYLELDGEVIAGKYLEGKGTVRKSAYTDNGVQKTLKFRQPSPAFSPGCVVLRIARVRLEEPSSSLGRRSRKASVNWNTAIAVDPHEDDIRRPMVYVRFVFWYIPDEYLECLMQHMAATASSHMPSMDFNFTAIGPTPASHAAPQREVHTVQNPNKRRRTVSPSGPNEIAEWHPQPPHGPFGLPAIPPMPGVSTYTSAPLVLPAGIDSNAAAGPSTLPLRQTVSPDLYGASSSPPTDISFASDRSGVSAQHSGSSQEPPTAPATPVEDTNRPDFFQTQASILVQTTEKGKERATSLPPLGVRPSGIPLVQKRTVSNMVPPRVEPRPAPAVQSTGVSAQNSPPRDAPSSAMLVDNQMASLWEETSFNPLYDAGELNSLTFQYGAEFDASLMLDHINFAEYDAFSPNTPF